MPKPVPVQHPATRLSPLHEILFKSWAKANGVQDHDDPNNSFDHRALFQHTNGLVQPHGTVNHLASQHNAAVQAALNGQPQESPAQGVEQLDPAMAAVEHHKNMQQAQTDHQKMQHQLLLEQLKGQQKMSLEQMKLQHKSAEADKDRQHKAQIAQQEQAQQEHARQQEMAQQVQMAQQDRAHQMQQAQMGHQHELQAAQMGQQHEAQQAQIGHEQQTKSTLMNEMLKRSAPQPQPQAPQGPPQGMMQ